MKAKPELISSYKELPSGKKIYFASDFHLGVPDKKTSREREMKIVKWLEHVSTDAQAIFLVGDLFDFWFEYKSTIPKGFLRFQGKLAALRDRGIAIHFFTGNHDLWMFGYFEEELGIIIHKNPIVLEINEARLFVGHGDGLGPGESTFKFIKRVFKHPFAIWLFQWVHPTIGVALAKFWSKRSRIGTESKDDHFLNEDEILYQFCKEAETHHHHDFYIFGHRHLPLEMDVSARAKYFNLGDWINHCTYLTFDGKHASLDTFDA